MFYGNSRTKSDVILPDSLLPVWVRDRVRGVTWLHVCSNTTTCWQFPLSDFETITLCPCSEYDKWVNCWCPTGISTESPDVVFLHLCHNFKGDLIILLCLQEKLLTAVDPCLILPCRKCTNAHQNFQYMYPQKNVSFRSTKTFIFEKKIPTWSNRTYL